MPKKITLMLLALLCAASLTACTNSLNTSGSTSSAAESSIKENTDTEGSDESTVTENSVEEKSKIESSEKEQSKEELSDNEDSSKESIEPVSIVVDFEGYTSSETLITKKGMIKRPIRYAFSNDPKTFYNLYGLVLIIKLNQSTATISLRSREIITIDSSLIEDIAPVRGDDSVKLKAFTEN